MGYAPRDKPPPFWGTIGRDAYLLGLGLTAGLFFDVSGLTQENPALALFLGGLIGSGLFGALLTNAWVKWQLERLSKRTRRVCYGIAALPVLAGLVSAATYRAPDEPCTTAPVHLNLTIEPFENGSFMRFVRDGHRLTAEFRYRLRNSASGGVAHSVTPAWGGSPIDVGPGQTQLFHARRDIVDTTLENIDQLAAEDLVVDDPAALIEEYESGDRSIMDLAIFYYKDSCGNPRSVSAKHRVWSTRTEVLQRTMTKQP